MRIQVVSDLHVEFHNVLPPVAEGADVLVCAGDLAPVGSGAVRYAAEAWAEARHVLYVPGNHEFYGADIDHARGQLAEECARHGITLLDPDAIVIDDVHFIGATLWTDLLLDGLARQPDHIDVVLTGLDVALEPAKQRRLAVAPGTGQHRAPRRTPAAFEGDYIPESHFR